MATLEYLALPSELTRVEGIPQKLQDGMSRQLPALPGTMASSIQLLGDGARPFGDRGCLAVDGYLQYHVGWWRCLCQYR